MPPRDSGSLPLFLSHTQRERDEFVRALGVADYDEINLLNLLCSYAAKRRTAKVDAADLLNAVTSWARSHGKPNLLGGAARGALRRLLAALERNGYATTKDDWTTILLRDGDRRAGRGERAVADIDKAYRAMEADPTAPFPSSATIQAPATALVPVSYSEFTAELVEAHASSTKILRIAFSDDMDILATPAVLPRLLDIARKRVHFHIQNNPNLYNYVLFELRKIPQFRQVMDQSRLYAFLESRQDAPPLFWVYLGLAVARSRNEDLLEPKHRPGRIALYESAYLLHGYWQREHTRAQERKRREADQEAVLDWIERSGRSFTMEELADVRDEAGKPLKDKYPDVRAFLEELLERQRAEAEGAGTVPPVVRIGETWMHRSAVLPQLLEEIRLSGELCRRSIESDWKPKLERGVVEDPAMSDDAAFEAAVAALTTARCRRLTALMERPGIVHLIITEAAESDPSAFKTHDLLFEALDDPRYKPFSRLFVLERERIVTRLVSNLGLLRRFLLRRRLKIRKPDARPAAPSGAPTAAPAAGQATPKAPDGAPAETLPSPAQTVKVTRPKHAKPTTVVVERPSRRRNRPKTMDEAMDKLKEAMSRKRR